MKRQGGEWVVSRLISADDFKAAVVLAIAAAEVFEIDRQTSGMISN